jgi:hypothetical protein
MTRLVRIAFACNQRRFLKRKISILSNEQGLALPLFAVFLIAFLITFALVIDLGNTLISRHKIQSIADSASLAGASMTKVQGIYDGSGNPIGYTPVVDLAAATDEANNVIQKNLSQLDLAGAGITITNQTVSEPTSNQVYVEIDFTVKTILLGRISQVTPINTVTEKVRATSEIKM